VVDSITPETETSTHYFWTFPRNYRVGDKGLSDFLQKGVHNTFLEDMGMLEGQQRIIDADPAAQEVDINADAASIQARRAVAQLLKEEARGREGARRRA
jgi:vanillate O-demethylase monooxygenase subunit